MKNIFLLQSYNPTRVLKNTQYNTFWLSTDFLDREVKRGVEKLQYQNIYITSDDKFIKDEFVTDGSDVIRASPKLVEAQGLVNRRKWEKIILTTNNDLIECGIQSIDDEFLKWFIENHTCEFVEVKHITTIPALQLGSPNGHLKYVINLPKEKSKREFINNTSKWDIDDFTQTNLEEVANKLYPDGCDGTDRSAEIYRRIFIEGATWQSDKTYTENDLKEAFEHGVGSGKYQAEYGDNAKGSMSFEYFIKQLKK